MNLFRVSHLVAASGIYHHKLTGPFYDLVTAHAMS